jgi:hypothetical protein
LYRVAFRQRFQSASLPEFPSQPDGRGFMTIPLSLLLGSNRSATLDDVDQHHRDGEEREQVKEPTECGGTDHPQQLHHAKNHGYRPEHVALLHVQTSVVKPSHRRFIREP